jgi:hypothetical protein
MGGEEQVHGAFSGGDDVADTGGNPANDACYAWAIVLRRPHG